MTEEPIKLTTEAELASVGDLVRIIAEDVHTANERDVPNAVQQLDETLKRLIDERIAAWFKEHSKSLSE